jgi:hypothetical protein
VIWDRIVRFSKDVENGEVQKHGKAAYFSKILNDEFGVSLELMPYRRKYKPRKKDKDNVLTLNFPK